MFEDNEKAIEVDVVTVTTFFKKLRKGIISKKDINTINLMALDGIDMAYSCHCARTLEEGEKIRKRIKRHWLRKLEDTDWHQ